MLACAQFNTCSDLWSLIKPCKAGQCFRGPLPVSVGWTGQEAAAEGFPLKGLLKRCCGNLRPSKCARLRHLPSSILTCPFLVFAPGLVVLQ